MSNTARAKGTKWETELLPILRKRFGSQVERAPLKGVLDRGDFVGVPWLHEAKSVQVPRFLEWARSADRKDPMNWTVLWTDDRRKRDSVAPLALLPMTMYLDLAGDAIAYDELFRATH